MGKRNKNRNNCYVYDLIDPRDFKTFYVGFGVVNRMHDHVATVKLHKIPNNNKKLFCKIRKILNCGYSDIIYFKSIENLSENDAKQYEIDRIAAFGRENLCNMTNGGEGGDTLPIIQIKN